MGGNKPKTLQAFINEQNIILYALQLSLSIVPLFNWIYVYARNLLPCSTYQPSSSRVGLISIICRIVLIFSLQTYEKGQHLYLTMRKDKQRTSTNWSLTCWKILIVNMILHTWRSTLIIHAHHYSLVYILCYLYP